MGFAADLAAEERADRADDPRPIRVRIETSFTYEVDEAWMRRQMFNDEDDIDRVAQDYCEAVEQGEADLPHGHVEFASIEFDTFHPA